MKFILSKFYNKQSLRIKQKLQGPLWKYCKTSANTFKIVKKNRNNAQRHFKQLQHRNS